MVRGHARHVVAGFHIYGAIAHDRHHPRDRLFDWSASPDDEEDRRRAATWLRHCLSKLQAVERQALVLAYEHGLSHGDLAAHLRKPLGTVKTWVRRGMENLRNCIESCMGTGR